MNTWAIFLTGAVTAGVACFPLHWLLVRGNVVDRPNARSSHAQPTARGGGIAVLLGLAAASGPTIGASLASGAWEAAALLAGAAGLAAVSFADDLRPLPASLRFACHLGAALAFLVALREGAEPTSTDAWALAAWVVALLGIVGYTNAFNFMDGINGLAASQAVLGCGGMAFAVLAADLDEHIALAILLAIAGAAAGFLPHNFPRARLFLGDVGSAPLGFLTAAITVWLTHRHGTWLGVPLALLHANFVLDTGITLARRIARGDDWTKPHREHFYQRFVRSGASHAQVTLTYSVLQIAAVAAVVCYPQLGPFGRGLTIALVPLSWLALFVAIEARFRRSQSAG